MSAQREPREVPERSRLDEAINELVQDGMHEPSDIASTIITTRKLEWRRFAYVEIEHWIVSERVREYFRKGWDEDEAEDDESEPEHRFGTPHRSAKERALAVGGRWVHIPSLGGYKLDKDCTSRDLREAAQFLEGLRDGLTRRIDAMYELANRLDDAGAETWRDLS